MDGLKKLRELREAAGLTREALSEKTGITATQIYRIESGLVSRDKIKFGTICAIARALDVSVEVFVRQWDLLKQFMTNIQNLNSREQSMLSRDAGKCVDEAHGSTLMPFYKALPNGALTGDTDDPERVLLTEKWFDVACMRAYNLKHAHPEIDPLRNVELPVAIAKIAKGRDAAEVKRFERRLANALDTSWDTDGLALSLVYKLMRVATQAGYNIDCASLLDDVLHWDDVEQTTNRKWVDLYTKHTY